MPSLAYSLTLLDDSNTFTHSIRRVIGVLVTMMTVTVDTLMLKIQKFSAELLLSVDDE